MLRTQPSRVPVKVTAQDSLQAESSSSGAAHKSWGCNPSHLITQHSWGHPCCGSAAFPSSSVIPSARQAGCGNKVFSWCESTQALLSLTGRQMKSQVNFSIKSLSTQSQLWLAIKAVKHSWQPGDLQLLAWGTPGTHCCSSLERKWRATGKQTLPILSLQ